MNKRREARAGEKRKSRAPIVSVEKLKKIVSDTKDRDLRRFAYRMEILEGLRKAGALNTPFIALEALGALSEGLVSGKSEVELRTAWPQEWGDETITVPIALILALATAWDDYRQAPSSKKLGEAFGIEGGKPGSHSMKAKLATIDRARNLANEVEIKYLKLENEDKSPTLNDVIHEVADAQGLSFKTVKSAHKEHRDFIRSALTDLEILKGVKNFKGQGYP